LYNLLYIMLSYSNI